MPKKESSARKIDLASPSKKVTEAKYDSGLSIAERNNLSVEKAQLEEQLQAINEDIQASVKRVNVLNEELQNSRTGLFSKIKRGLSALTGKENNNSEVNGIEDEIAEEMEVKQELQAQRNHVNAKLRTVIKKLSPDFGADENEPVRAMSQEEKEKESERAKALSKQKGESIKAPQRSLGQHLKETTGIEDVMSLPSDLVREVKERGANVKKAEKLNQDLQASSYERIAPAAPGYKEGVPVYVEKANDLINQIADLLPASSFGELKHDALLKLSDSEADAWVSKLETSLQDKGFIKDLKAAMKTRSKEVSGLGYSFASIEKLLKEYRDMVPEISDEDVSFDTGDEKDTSDLVYSLDEEESEDADEPVTATGMKKSGIARTPVRAGSSRIPAIGHTATTFQGQQRSGGIKWQGAMRTTQEMGPDQIRARYDQFQVDSDGVKQILQNARRKFSAEGTLPEEEQARLKFLVERINDRWENSVNLDMQERGLSPGQFKPQNEQAEQSVREINLLARELENEVTHLDQHVNKDERVMNARAKVEKTEKLANEIKGKVGALANRADRAMARGEEESARFEALENGTEAMLERLGHWLRLQHVSTKEGLIEQFGRQLTAEQGELLKLEEMLEESKKNGENTFATEKSLMQAKQALKKLQSTHERNLAMHGFEKVIGEISKDNTSIEADLDVLEQMPIRELMERSLESTRQNLEDAEHMLKAANPTGLYEELPSFQAQAAGLRIAREKFRAIEQRKRDALEATEMGENRGFYTALYLDLSNHFKDDARELQIVLGNKDLREAWLKDEENTQVRNDLRSKFERLDELAPKLGLSFPKIELSKEEMAQRKFLGRDYAAVIPPKPKQENGPTIKPSDWKGLEEEDESVDVNLSDLDKEMEDERAARQEEDAQADAREGQDEIDQESARFKAVWDTLQEKSNAVWQVVVERLKNVRKNDPEKYQDLIGSMGMKTRKGGAIEFVQMLSDYFKENGENKLNTKHLLNEWVDALSEEGQGDALRAELMDILGEQGEAFMLEEKETGSVLGGKAQDNKKAA